MKIHHAVRAGAILLVGAIVGIACAEESEPTPGLAGTDGGTDGAPRVDATTPQQDSGPTTPTCLDRGDPCTGDNECCSGLCCGDFQGCC